MIVVGGRDSANTRKLAELAGRVCPQTYHIEDPAELAQLPFRPAPASGLQPVHLHRIVYLRRLLHE